jgi:hypothetical protein
MQDAFEYVVFGVVAVGVLAALVSVFLTGRAYEQIGKGGLYTDEDAVGRGPVAPGNAADLVERDDEIRQMLVARNARRAAAGRATVDVEAELARLTAPALDEGLRAEIRRHVLARNERLVRRGRPPLDVEAEVERYVRELPGQ